jgi:hypothetical protein
VPPSQDGDLVDGWGTCAIKPILLAYCAMKNNGTCVVELQVHGEEDASSGLVSLRKRVGLWVLCRPLCIMTGVEDSDHRLYSASSVSSTWSGIGPDIPIRIVGMEYELTSPGTSETEWR